MRRLPLQTLPTFRAVADLGSLRAASDQLHISHSAISQQIRLLEDQLGFVLFERRGRRVILNPAGAILLRAVDAALDQLDGAVRAAATLSGGADEQFRLTVLPSFAQHWLLPRMANWRALHPTIALDLHTSLQVIDLKREGLHAALRQGRGPWRGLEGIRLTESPLIPVASPATAKRLAGCPISQLANEPLLGDSARWERWFAQVGHPCHVQPVAIFNDMGMLVQAVEQGLGIGLTRQLVAADALRDGRLVPLSLSMLADDGTDTFWLLYPPELKDWPPVIALCTWIRAEFARSAADVQAVLSSNTLGALHPR